jgi:hypothetical protein
MQATHTGNDNVYISQLSRKNLVVLLLLLLLLPLLPYSTTHQQWRAIWQQLRHLCKPCPCCCHASSRLSFVVLLLLLLPCSVTQQQWGATWQPLHHPCKPCTAMMTRLVSVLQPSRLKLFALPLLLLLLLLTA